MTSLAIEVENLVKVFHRHGRAPTRAVDGLTFSIAEGSIFGLLGPNGAGKTTTLRVLTTLARPTGGRARVAGFDVVASPLDVRRRIAVVIQEHAADLAAGLRPPPIPKDPQTHPESLADYVSWLMDQDRKSTPLKSIQGKIWEAGYNRGEIESEVFADVPRAFERWTSQRREICIYSSGSVLAQKLLFANTNAGDLTRFIRAYFDTSIGPKKEAASYRRIAAEVRRSPNEVLFLSDTTAELAAARKAAFDAMLCSRPGNQQQQGEQEYNVVGTFDDIFPT